jgi:hypothetical protein
VRVLGNSETSVSEEVRKKVTDKSGFKVAEDVLVVK